LSGHLVVTILTARPTTRQAPLASESSSAFAANISEASYYTLALCSGFSLFSPPPPLSY